MKKFIIILIFIALLLETIVVQAEEEELDIRIEALKERQYSSVALTDQYETEILTAKSNEYSVKIAKMKEEKTKQLERRLFLNIDEKESSALLIQEQATNIGLFADGYSAKSTSGNIIMQKEKNIIWMIVCALGCIITGYVLAVVRHRFRKAQKMML